MEPQDFGFDSWQEILDILEQAGMTDYEDYPELNMAWEVGKYTHDIDLLNELLTKDPWIMEEAKRIAKACPFFQPKREEMYMIQGLFNLGCVNPHFGQIGLNPLDFTRGLYICGEIGSGKTYPVLRLIDQILSIPKRRKQY